MQLVVQLHSPPNPVRNTSPHSCEDSPATIDYTDVPLLFYGFHNAFRHILGLHQHREVRGIGQQRSVYETGANVREANVITMIISQLLQGLQVGVLHSFRGTVGRNGSQALCACHGSDADNVSATVCGKIAIGFAHHTHKTKTIGLHCLHFFFEL